MTWGRQNSESEAFEQMDYSLDKGVNFFDTGIALFLYSIKVKIRPPEIGFASLSLTNTSAPTLKVNLDDRAMSLFFSLFNRYLSLDRNERGISPLAPVSSRRTKIHDLEFYRKFMSFFF